MLTYKVEKELHSFIVDNFSNYFDFKYIKSEVLLPVGRVDILGEDDTTVYVIEIKRDCVNKAAITQVTGYIPQVELLYPNKKVVGIVVAPVVEKGAADINPDIKIVELTDVNFVPPVSRSTIKRITFTLEESTIDKLREVSKESMIPQARIIEDMIEKYLDSYKKSDK